MDSRSRGNDCYAVTNGVGVVLAQELVHRGKAILRIPYQVSANRHQPVVLPEKLRASAKGLNSSLQTALEGA